MTKQFKVGDKVRIVNVGGISGGRAYFKNGDESHVLRVGRDGLPYLYCNDGDYSDGLVLTENELRYIELISPNPNRMAELESRIAELERQVAELTPKKKRYTLSELLNPNQQRKATIERAKAFVERHSVEMRQNLLAPRFFINATKRTVVCLLDRFDLGYVHAKGIAKCAPDDVFNADIGKAIALGRALGLDVSEFENAPKPTEVVVGMVVRGKNTKHVYDVKGFHDREEYGGVYGRPIAIHGVHSYVWVGTEQVTIIEDIEAQYV